MASEKASQQRRESKCGCGISQYSYARTRMPALRAAATLHRDQSVRDRLAAGRDMHGRKAIVNISVATRTLFNQLREKEGREKGKRKEKGRSGGYEWSLGSCESCAMKGCVKDAKKEEYWPPKV